MRCFADKSTEACNSVAHAHAHGFVWSVLGGVSGGCMLSRSHAASSSTEANHQIEQFLGRRDSYSVRLAMCPYSVIMIPPVVQTPLAVRTAVSPVHHPRMAISAKDHDCRRGPRREGDRCAVGRTVVTGWREDHPFRRLQPSSRAHASHTQCQWCQLRRSGDEGVFGTFMSPLTRYWPSEAGSGSGGSGPSSSGDPAGAVMQLQVYRQVPTC